MADYKHTINLPQTDFPMKADLAQREPAAVRAWDERGTYARLREEAPIYYNEWYDFWALSRHSDVEQALPCLQAQLRGHELAFGLLRLLQRLCAAREHRAAVGHRRIEEQGEELVRQVVMRSDVAPRAGPG